MNTIIQILRGLYGLFVDDELLALSVLGVVGITAVLVLLVGTKLLAAGVLLCGNVLILIVGTLRTARRMDRP